VSFGLPPAYKRQREAHELQKEAKTMTQFHEGQEVEVATTALESRGGRALRHFRVYAREDRLS